MATNEITLTDPDDDSELLVRETLGQPLDPRLSFGTFLDVPYLDQHEVENLRDFLSDWLAKLP